MRQLNELPDRLVDNILECFSLRPVPRDNGIACCNRALSSSWERTRCRLVLEWTSQVRNALRGNTVLNSLSQPLVAAMIHRWVVHEDARPPLMMGSELVKSLLNHWRADVTLWMDPHTQEEYRYCLEIRGRQRAHQLKKSRFSAYLWQNGFRR